jgi:hypothetical protein
MNANKLQELIDAAIAVAETWEANEEDRSDCPYNRRHSPGADPHGSCSYGCHSEPSCQTDGPWPMDRLVIAVDRLRS